MLLFLNEIQKDKSVVSPWFVSFNVLFSSLMVRDLSVGRGSTATVGGGALPKIHTVKPWDGKDGEVSAECFKTRDG